jgi:hypothetical protein
LKTKCKNSASGRGACIKDVDLWVNFALHANYSRGENFMKQYQQTLTKGLDLASNGQVVGFNGLACWILASEKTNKVR